MWSKGDIYEALAQQGELPLTQACADFFAKEPSPWQARQLALVRERALAYLREPAQPIPYSVFKLYWTTGDRATHHPLYFERRGRLLVFSVMCLCEPQDARWVSALEDTVWQICAEPFWCLPAHFFAADETPLPFEAYATQLDLFACETAFALAEMLSLCGGKLSADVASQARLQIEKRVLTPFCDANVFYRFENMRSNWSAVCGAAIGGAALYLVKDRARLTALLHRCLSCMDVYLSSFGEDGVCVEGVGYWTYGFGFYTCFADMLNKRTAGALDLFSIEKAAAIARCQQNYYLSGAYTVSFADGGTRSGFRMGLSCYLQQLFPDAALPEESYADDMLHDNCYRYCLSIRDLLWYTPHARFGLPAERSTWLAQAEWLLSASGSLALAAKAGNNGEGHNHNDCGSFILCKNGKPLLCDFGAGLYSADYFGPNRYSIFVNSSRSHSVPMPAECEQVEGARHTCTEVVPTLGDAADTLRMNLTACYDCPPLTSLTRSITHDKRAHCVTLQDEAAFHTPQAFTEVFVSSEPIVLENGCAQFGEGDACLTLRFDEAAFSARVFTQEYPAHELGVQKTAWLLHLCAVSDAAAHTCTVTLQ